MKNEEYGHGMEKVETDEEQGHGQLGGKGKQGIMKMKKGK